MTILLFPTDRLYQRLPAAKCVVCQQHTTLKTATPGRTFANGKQAFACAHHIECQPAWVIGWATFDNSQLAAMNSTIGRDVYHEH